MSRTAIRLEFSVVIEDIEHWSPENLARCAEDNSTDWASAGLYDAMVKAGEEYIKNHPDLFNGELM